MELADKLDTPELTWDLTAMYASDLVGRSQVFSRLVQGEVSPEPALAIAGLMVAEQ